MKTKPLSKKERINALILHLDIKIKQLAEIVGMNPNTFYHISDNSRFGISEKTASKISYNLKKKLGVDVNRDWLLTGEGEMIVPNSAKPSLTNEVPLESSRSNVIWREKYYTLLEKYVVLLEKQRQ